MQEAKHTEERERRIKEKEMGQRQNNLISSFVSKRFAFAAVAAARLPLHILGDKVRRCVCGERRERNNKRKLRHGGRCGWAGR